MLAQSNLASGADPAGARSVLDRFHALNAASRLASPEAQPLLSGELADFDRPSVGTLPADDRLVLLSDGRAVARLPAQGEEFPDTYLFLRRGENGEWSIIAYRSLALTGLPRELRRLLRAQAVRTDEEEAMLRNIELTLASDKNLRDWFFTHRTALDRLPAIAAEAAAQDGPARVDTEEARAILAELDARVLTSEAGGVTRLTIGGLVDNEVGFLHADDPAAVPPLEPSGHIWIEPVGDGWYLFKTT